MGGDGQVTVGETVMKHGAKKVRKLYKERVLAGFAGATADAFTLFERFENKLEQYRGNFSRAAVELAKDWRTDRTLRRLEALMIISDPTSRAMETAAVIKSMIETEKIMECRKLGLVFNRVAGNEALLKDSARKIGLEIFGFVPNDEQIAAYDLVGKPITQLPADSLGQAAVREIVERCVLA